MVLNACKHKGFCMYNRYSLVFAIRNLCYKTFKYDCVYNNM